MNVIIFNHLLKVRVKKATRWFKWNLGEIFRLSFFLIAEGNFMQTISKPNTNWIKRLTNAKKWFGFSSTKRITPRIKSGYYSERKNKTFYNLNILRYILQRGCDQLKYLNKDLFSNSLLLMMIDKFVQIKTEKYFSENRRNVLIDFLKSEEQYGFLRQRCSIEFDQ